MPNFNKGSLGVDFLIWSLDGIDNQIVPGEFLIWGKESEEVL